MIFSTLANVATDPRLVWGCWSVASRQGGPRIQNNPTGKETEEPRLKGN